jgi:hypothetical protein
MANQQTFVAFVGDQLVVRGSVESVILGLHPLSVAKQAALRLLEEGTGRAVDLDWRGRADEVVSRAKAQLGPNLRGRPRLGVESREITLLPRHWTWLDAQGRAASVILRDLVNEAMGQPARGRVEVDALYRQMSALAGDLPGFEEAARQLYGGDWTAVERIVATWPGDFGGYFSERVRAVAGVGA